MYLIALDTRFPKICWQSEASVTTCDSGSAATASQLRPLAKSGRPELAIDLPDDGTERERPVRGGPGPVDEPGIIEISASESEQVIAERDHCQEMPALFDSHRGASVSEQKVKPCSQRDQGAAQFVAQTSEQGPELTLIDGVVSAFGRGAAGVSWCSRCTSMASLSVVSEG